MSEYDSPEFQSQMQNFLMDAVRLSQKAREKVDGTELRRQRTILVDSMVKYAREEIIPQFEKSTFKTYTEVRASRSFESEINRLWKKASEEYEKLSANEIIENLPPIVSEQIFSDDPDYARHGFESAARIELKLITIPVLEAQQNPGDDIQLYSLFTLSNPDEEVITDHIAETLLAPPQMLYSLLGIFGLLIQARRAADQEKIENAYSYLIDASHMIGMLESSTWLTKRFDKIAASRNGKLNSKKDTKKKIAMRQAKSYVEYLFHDLMPNDNNGFRRWKSSEAALTAINAYLCDNKIDLGITDGTIKKECERLNRTDKKNKKNNKFNFLANYVFVKRDGTKVNIPIPLDD